MTHSLHKTEYKDIDTILHFLDKRKIVIWGTGDVGKYIYRVLLEHNIEPYCFLDSNIDRQQELLFNKPILSPNILKNKKTDFYVIIGVQNYFSEMIALLLNYHYNHLNDYQYFYPPIDVKKSQNYSDAFGNEISGCVCNDQVKFLGKNNKLIIEDNADISQLSFEFLYNDSKVIIGKSSHLKGLIHITDNSFIHIGENCRSGCFSEFIAERGSKLLIHKNVAFESNCSTKASDHSILEINKNASIQKDFFALSKYNSSISIGENFKSSLYVSIVSNDGHPIFDVQTKKQLNIAPKKIYIDKQVWLGIKSTILTGTTIGSGSIVGANTVITHQAIPNNCIVAGNPAHIIKKNIIWDNYETNINLITNTNFWQMTLDN